MLENIFKITYIAMIPISWLVISGWLFADSVAFSKGLFGGPTHIRSDSGFVTAWSAFAALLWPIFLPGTFCYTGYAEHGWRPVWRIKE